MLQHITLQSPFGGKNTEKPNFVIGDNEFEKLLNCWASPAGAIIVKRGGYEKYNSALMYITEQLTDGALENWDDATTPTDWTGVTNGSSTVNREDANQHAGDHCARLDVDATPADVGIYQDVTLSASEYFELAFYAYISAAGTGDGIQYRIVKDPGGTPYYLQNDGTWTTDSNWFDTDLTDAFVEYSKTFQASGADTYRVQFQNKAAGSKSIYIDDVTLLEAEDVLSLFRFQKSSGDKYLLCASGSAIWKVNESTKVWSTIKTGLTTGKYYDFAVYNDKCYITNGTDTVFYYDGSSCTNAADIEKGEYFLIRKERLWTAGVTDYLSRIFYSDAGDPETFGVTSYLDVGTAANDWITGIAELNDQIIVFKRYSTWRILEDSDGNFYIRNAHPSIGCVSHFSIKNTENGLIFMSDKGLYYFDGIQFTRLSRVIPDDEIDISRTNVTKACAVIYKNDYGNYYLVNIAQSGQASNTKMLVLNSETLAFSTFDCGFHCALVDTYDNTFYVGGDNGQVYEFDSTQGDDGSAIDVQAHFKNIDFGDAGTFKFIRDARIELSETQGTVSCQFVADGGLTSQEEDLSDLDTSLYHWDDAGVKWDDAGVTWGEIEDLLKYIALSLVGKRMQPKIVNNESDSYLKVKAITIGYRLKRRRQRWE